ncbi:MAG: hypothetical protein Q9P01_06830 [Anaerolineae bacterium]|nr:hypothetical protein [Anaerolineae bacterium]
MSTTNEFQENKLNPWGSLDWTQPSQNTTTLYEEVIIHEIETSSTQFPATMSNDMSLQFVAITFLHNQMALRFLIKFRNI